MITVIRTWGDGPRCLGHYASYEEAVAAAAAQRPVGAWHLIERVGSLRAWTCYTSANGALVRWATGHQLCLLYDSLLNDSAGKLYDFTLREIAHQRVLELLERLWPVASLEAATVPERIVR